MLAPYLAAAVGHIATDNDVWSSPLIVLLPNFASLPLHIQAQGCHNVLSVPTDEDFSTVEGCISGGLANRALAIVRLRCFIRSHHCTTDTQSYVVCATIYREQMCMLFKC